MIATSPSLRCVVGALGLGLVLLASCRTPTHTRDATVRILTPDLPELGVATDYGIVFLGRGQQSGNVQFDVWFGKDANREIGVVESVGGDLYATEAEIRIPRVPVTFVVPPVDTEVLILSRATDGRRRNKAVICSHPSVTGLLLRMTPGSPTFEPTQIGAGVYVERRGRPYFLGLVSGCVSLQGADGSLEEYIAVVGPTETWRVVTHGRNRSREQHWVYREDIL